MGVDWRTNSLILKKYHVNHSLGKWMDSVIVTKMCKWGGVYCAFLVSQDLSRWHLSTRAHAEHLKSVTEVAPKIFANWRPERNYPRQNEA